jgi:simple sugar transport system permease protein
MIEFLGGNTRSLRYIAIALGIVFVILIFALLPLNLLQSSIRLATPYVLGSLAALIASRAGVLNLAIEGKMTIGAFVAVLVLYKTGLDPTVGVIAATLAGGVLGLVFAILYLRIKINLIILALAVNLFIANVTVFIMRVKFGAYGTLADPSISSLPTLNIPILSQIPFFGDLLGHYNIIVYLSWLMVIVVWLILFRTQFGRHIRAVGENKAAAESVGINVTRVQIFALTLSGMLAGMAGAFLSIGVLSQYLEGMTANRGWTSITVSLFAFEQPIAAFATSLFFGLAEALSFYLQGRPELAIPVDLLLALPQVLTLLALIAVAARIRGGELIKRRNFAAQFGAEMSKLRQGILAGDPPTKRAES